MNFNDESNACEWCARTECDCADDEFNTIPAQHCWECGNVLKKHEKHLCDQCDARLASIERELS